MPPGSERKRSVSAGLLKEYQMRNKSTSTQTCDENGRMHTSDGLSRFHLFPRLPTELQMMILNKAADPDEPQPRPKWWPSYHTGYRGHGYGNEVLKDEVLEYLLTHLAHTRSYRAPGLSWLFFLQRPDREWDDLYIGLEIFKSRMELLGTSRLARLVALEAWKRDLEIAVGTEEERKWQCLPGEPTYSYKELQEERMRLVIESMDMQIVDVRRGMKTS